MEKVFVLLLCIAMLHGKQQLNDLIIPGCYPCTCLHRGVLQADCSSLNLIHIPESLPAELGILNIANNKIRTLNTSLHKYTKLKYLNVSNNTLNALDKDDFISLVSLEVLDLHENSLSLTNSTYPRGLFRNQRNLTTLVLHLNSETEGSHLQYPDETFSDLVSLEHMYIDGLKTLYFGPGFKKLNKLTSLSIKGNCDIGTLKNESFTFLSSVRNLSIARCGLLDIEANAFKGLSNKIDTIDMSLNSDLGIRSFGHSLYGLQNKSVDKLIANKLHRRRGTGIEISYENLQYIRNIDMNELQIEDNRIELLEINVPPLLSSLKRLSLKNNMLLFGGYIVTSSGMEQLKWLDVSGQHTSHVDPFTVEEELIALLRGNVSTVNQESNRLYHPEVQPDKKAIADSILFQTYVKKIHDLLSIRTNDRAIVYPPPSVTYVNISHSKFRLTIPAKNFGPNKLEIFDLSHNFFTKWIGPVTGLDKVVYLDLSNNYCDYMSPIILAGFPALKILKISNNYLGYTLENSHFNCSSNLQHLDLSNNKIFQLPPDIFSALKSLQYLNLSLNNLKTWDVNVHNMVNLTVLDLSKNQFEQIPDRLVPQIQSLDGTHRRLKVYISGNPFKCTCNYLSSMKWLYRNSGIFIDVSNLTCTYYDGIEANMTNLQEIILDLEKSCASYIGVAVGVLSFIILFLAVAVAGILYRYRWKVRYLYYLTLNKHRGYLLGQDEEQNYEFDAFISYADEDRGFVVRDMRRILEEPEEQQERFQLCIHHRDFLPGEAIAANILKAIKTSRKTVVILTRNFLKSYWCRYEVEMAKMESIYRGRNTLLIVVMEDIPVKDLPGDIVDVMRKDSYVEFTNTADGKEIFWHSLKKAIRPN